MPQVHAGFTMNYEQQGSGEPLLLIPYLAADHACYAFQVAEFAKHFTCISLDLRGTGESADPQTEYTTETLADDVAAFMNASGVTSAHIFGLSLGAGVGLWMGAKYPDKVRSLSLHGAWTKTDSSTRTVIQSWQLMARALNSVPEMTIRGIFPWCFTPELYASRPDYIESLAGFVRSRPAASVDAFIRQSNAVLSHDVEAQLTRITAPTQVTVGARDMVTPVRCAETIRRAIADSEMVVFDGCSHAALYENTEEFNRTVLAFLQRKARAQAA
jgi:pimeloyl-ACP methyl ester carboxylesterase